MHLIIGTPGRLWEIIEQEAVSLKNIEILILDEADRLLDLDYDDKVNYIVDKLPRQRRTGLFSATMTTKVEGLIKAGLRNPVYISVKVKSITGN